MRCKRSRLAQTGKTTTVNFNSQCLLEGRLGRASVWHEGHCLKPEPDLKRGSGGPSGFERRPVAHSSRGLYERFYRDTVTNISNWLDERNAS
jgi:hypothetical protein